MKKFILPIICGLLILAAVPVTMLLVRQSQDIRNKASSLTGTATVKLDPGSKTDLKVGDIQLVAIKITPPANQTTPYTGIQTLITYTYTGSTPEIEILDAEGNASGQITPALSNFTYGSNKVTKDDSAKTISIELIAGNSAGYVPTGEFTFGSFKLKANAVTTGITLTFNSALSKLYQSDNRDILLTPDSSSNGNYAVIAAAGATVYQHLVCQNNACKKVDCSPNNVACNNDRECSTENASCTPGDQTHKACVNSTCVTVAGSGDNGCSTDSDCVQAVHYECVGNSCNKVSGAGQSTCVTNSDCTTTITTTTDGTGSGTAIATQPTTLPVTADFKTTVISFTAGVLLVTLGLLKVIVRI